MHCETTSEVMSDLAADYWPSVAFRVAVVDGWCFYCQRHMHIPADVQSAPVCECCAPFVGLTDAEIEAAVNVLNVEVGNV